MGADVTVTIDADMQHDPRDIPMLVQAIRTEHADVVVGSRFIKDSKVKSKVPRKRAIGNKMLTTLTNRNVTDTQSGYRAYSRRALDCLKPTERGMGIDSELIMKAEEKKLKIVEVPIKVRYDVPNPSKQGSVSQGGGVVLSVIKRLSIRRPLSFYGIPGMISLIFALIFWIWSIQSFATTRQLITNVTLVAIGTTLVGLMLLTTAIILWVLVGVVTEAADTGRQNH
jgi:glycosyltransferase involved in cell wall biosynthesis